MGGGWKFNSSWKTEEPPYSKADSDSRYVNVTGDTMTGDLTITSTGESTFEEAVRFNSAVKIGNDTTRFELSGDTLNLYVNDVVKESWTQAQATTAPVYIATGTPMGILLTLTYQL